MLKIKNNVQAVLEEYLLTDNVAGKSEADLATEISQSCNVDLTIWRINYLDIK